MIAPVPVHCFSITFFFDRVRSRFRKDSCCKKIPVSMSYISMTVFMLHLLKELMQAGVLRCVKYLFPNKNESSLSFSQCNAFSVVFRCSTQIETFNADAFSSTK